MLDRPAILVGHLAPDIDCVAAIWMLMRFGGAEGADLQFVPAGTTLHNLPPDADRQIVHVDTGGGRFDHHQRAARDLCAAELVRRAVAPDDLALQRMVRHVNRIDNAQTQEPGGPFGVGALLAGYNLLFPDQPRRVLEMMLPNLDAWYAHEARQIRLEQAFARRIEFETPWGLGIAMESDDGGSSRLAYGHGAVLYAYRDGHGWMGVAAQSRSHVDLTPVYADLQRVDGGADWYLHPNKRLLLCGTSKAPPRVRSRLTLEELVRVIRGDWMFT